MASLPIRLLTERGEAQDRELAELDALLAAVEGRVRSERTPDHARYRRHPVAYSRQVLGVAWWKKQREIARALVRPPYRVLVKASHSVGKSMLAGGLVNWCYDAFRPGVVLTTAPTARQVRDVLWKEVRRQRRGRGGFPGPKIPRLEDAPDHFAHGFTARDATSFQGQHEDAVFVFFDEAVGVGAEFWEAAESMVQGVRFAFLAIYNPTDTSSACYAEEQAALETGRATVVEIPATIHPNIRRELDGRPPKYPSAVRLAWLADKIGKWCEPIRPEDATATDLLWPPAGYAGSRWHRPGPLAEARLLARWPSAAAGVWSDALWGAAERPLPVPAGDLPEVGLDVARFGDDDTEFHVRCGPVSLHHERHNGWGLDQTEGRLRQICREWAAWAMARRPSGADPVRPESVLCKVDDDGVGGGVVDHAAGWNWVGVGAGAAAFDPEDYPNRRSELWFAVADRARRGELSVLLLPRDVRLELKRQAVTPSWKLDADGRRVIEPKDRIKARLGRSPDGMDAMNLAYAPAAGGEVARWVGGGGERQNWRDRHGRRR